MNQTIFTLFEKIIVIGVESLNQIYKKDNWRKRGDINSQIILLSTTEMSLREKEEKKWFFKSEKRQEEGALKSTGKRNEMMELEKSR